MGTETEKNGASGHIFDLLNKCNFQTSEKQR